MVVQRLISDYAFALNLLDEYNYQRIEDVKGKSKSIYNIELHEGLEAISDFRKVSKTSDLFARHVTSKSCRKSNGLSHPLH